MITKIKTHKIEYQSNSMIFIWNYDNFIESKQKNNNENQLKINQILKDILKKKDSIVKKKKKGPTQSVNFETARYIFLSSMDLKLTGIEVAPTWLG